MPNYLCPICHSSEYQKLLKTHDHTSHEDFFVIYCKNCKIGSTSPQPENIDAYYPSGYRNFIMPMRILFEFIYNRFAEKITKNYGKPGTLLEIGCGAGWLLKAFHNKGWEVVGLERTVEMACMAADNTGLNIYSESLDTVEHNSLYDIIIMSNVLEHIVDPKKIIEDCHKYLKSDGTMIIVVPNNASWQANIFGGYWAHLDTPRHLFHFTPRSIESLLNQRKFKIAKRNPNSFMHDMFGWIQSSCNYLDFEQNQIQTILSNLANVRDTVRISNLWILLICGLLGLPFACLSVVSWISKSGAIMELWVKKAD